MFDRSCFGALLLIGLALPIAGCGSATGIDSIQVTPATVSFGGTNLTAQLKATGTINHGNHPATTEDITGQVTWTTGSKDVATVSKTGLVTSVGSGSIQITATIQGFTGLLSASSTVTVTATGGGTTGGTIVSISIIPGSQSVASPGQTTQFIAIGTTSSGATEDITDKVTWVSSAPQVASITSGNAGGLAKGLSQGTSAITAIAVNTNGTVVTGTATFTVLAAAVEQVTALTVYPASQAATSQDQNTQFFVLGAEGASGLLFDVTNSPQLAWTSSNTAVVTIGTYGNGTPGLATSVGTGTASFTATWTNTDKSKVVGTATYSVTIGAAQEPLISINVVPAGIQVSNRGMTGQYLAFGTYSTTPTVRDLTNTVTWISLLPEVASIDSGGVTGEIGGLATAQGYTGFTPIYAEATNPDGTVVLSNTQTFTCKDPNSGFCVQDIAHPQFATITVYIEGEDTGKGLVTAPSDTGTPNLIHCGPGWTGTGGQVCTGTYATGSKIKLTEHFPSGSPYFGGWSSGDGVGGGVDGAGCQPPPPPNDHQPYPTTCTVTLLGDTSIGALFY